MKHFDLVINTCNTINRELSSKFREEEIWFIRASLENVAYGINEMEIIFNFSPERYEYGNSMTLKGILVKLNYDNNRIYSIIEAVSFCNNRFQNYNVEAKVYSIKEMVDNFLTFKRLINLEENSIWESKIIEYNKNKFKFYSE